MLGAEISQSKFHDVSHFGLRLAIGSIFIAGGLIKFDPSFATYLPQMGLPANMQYLFALQEFIPGILIIAGVLTRISASVLSLVMLGVIFYVDKASKFIGPDGVELPVILFAVSIVIITVGPGRISISHAIKKIPRFLQ
ncbi:DoxX family protein [Candidatus Nitrosotalea okcheonensis]|uniref:DoxX family protein n=1 Tax=Candidatus Nitrosotalea okcheonensis TaxID=1903276 RepID=A0A2H1FD30_9ARCH|nr:DoxX family protein [Candidatus Nitrosotalea okcheonensis]MDE1832173.1 DoxX family protein [Nitrososphaerota archaeon]MDE1878586.1 DoxX family protein [Nitrososphaerota archaeon]SMH70673.1 DoxX family protein [Candidatus Nitrosotalea okcheonensis]